MNYCRKCQSDYSTPGTCNCFAPVEKRDPLPPVPIQVTPWPPPAPLRPYVGDPPTPYWKGIATIKGPIVTYSVQ